MVSPNFNQRLINRWNELVINNPKITPQMRYQLSQISNADIILISKYKDIQYFKKEYQDGRIKCYGIQKRIYLWSKYC